jgi:hypothetical protein
MVRVLKSKPLDEKTHAQLAALNAEVGERRAREFLGLSPEAYARALSRLNIQQGTAALVHQRLSERRGGAVA